MARTGSLTVLVAAVLVASPFRAIASHLVENTVDNLRSIVDNAAGVFPRIALECPFAAGSSLLPGDCAFNLTFPIIAPSDAPFGRASIVAAATDADALVAFADQAAQAASKRNAPDNAR